MLQSPETLYITQIFMPTLKCLFPYNPAILNAYNPIRHLGDFLIVGYHHHRLFEFFAGYLQKSHYILAGLAVQVPGRLV